MVFSGYSGFLHHDGHDIAEILLKVALNTIDKTRSLHPISLPLLDELTCTFANPKRLEVLMKRLKYLTSQNNLYANTFIDRSTKNKLLKMRIKFLMHYIAKNQ